MTGRNVDLVLGMTMKDFLDANNRAYVEYSKTKSRIEKNPVNLQVKGGKDFDMMSMRIASVGNAFQSLGSEVKPVINLLTQTNMSSKSLAQAFVGLSDVGLRTFQMVSILRVGVNGLQASLGPIGWLMLGITAVATAFSLFSSSGDEATETAKNFSKELNRPDFLPDWLIRPDQLVKSFGIGALVKQQKIAMVEMQKAAEQNNITAYDKAKKYYDDVTELIKKYTDLANVAAGGKTQKEIEESEKAKKAEMKKMNDLVEYQFQTNRMRLSDYLNFQRAYLIIIEAEYGKQSAEYLKQTDKIRAGEEALLQYQSKNQKQLTADFTKNIDKRTKEEVKRISITTDAHKESIAQLDVLYNNFSNQLAGDFRNLFVKQLDDGIVRLKDYESVFINTLINIVASEAASNFLNFLKKMGGGGGFMESGGLSGLAALIPGVGPFLSLGLGLFGLAGGGKITQEHVSKSIFTPQGEDGLIGVQVGETIVNRRASHEFEPILERMNEMGRISYATGGRINDPGLLSSINNKAIAELINAISNIEIKVENNIQANLDAISFLRENYPRYQRVINKNRI